MIPQIEILFWIGLSVCMLFGQICTIAFVSKSLGVDEIKLKMEKVLLSYLDNLNLEL